MGRTKDMGVVNTRKKRDKKKVVQITTQNIKTTKNKKRLNKKVTLTCVHKWKDDNQISQKGVMITKQRKMKSTKEIQILLVHN